jgi:hypothetical protein
VITCPRRQTNHSYVAVPVTFHFPVTVSATWLSPHRILLLSYGNSGRRLPLRQEAITVARVLNETDTLRKTGRTLIWGSHRLLHGVLNVKSSVANNETGFKVLTLKHLLECSKVNRQPMSKRETKFKE